MSSLEQPWWEHLDLDFFSSPEEFELECRDRTMVHVCAALDTCIRTAAAVTIGTLAIPVGYNPLRIRRDRADETLYTTAAEAHDPSLFFIPPPRSVPFRVHKSNFYYYAPVDGVCEKISFKSPYRLANARLSKTFERHKRNQIAHALYWRHNAGPRPTVIAIHGFYADAYWLNERFFEIRGFYKLGCDVVLFTLPFHGPRQGQYSLFSGQGFFGGGAAQINEAFGQAVTDVRVVLNFLEDARGVEDIGVTGISLGGYTSALLATLEPRLKFALPNVPVATIPDLLLEWPPVSQVMQLIMQTTGFSLVEARRLMAVHCPLTYSPLLEKDRLMVIGGVGDRLVPPKHSRLLWEHWGRCRLHWFPGSHVLHLDKGDYIFEIERFLRDIEFLR